MLTRNIWHEVGLFNGALGTVFDIGWADGADPERDPPSVLLVVFDRYTGPLFTPDGGVPCVDSQGQPAVPVLPERQDFTYKNNTCWREQLPLAVAYAITVHKAQGVTLIVGRSATSRILNLPLDYPMSLFLGSRR